MRLSAEFQFLVLGILPHQHLLGCQKFPLVSPISVACIATSSPPLGHYFTPSVAQKILGLSQPLLLRHSELPPRTPNAKLYVLFKLLFLFFGVNTLTSELLTSLTSGCLPSKQSQVCKGNFIKLPGYSATG